MHNSWLTSNSSYRAGGNTAGSRAGEEIRLLSPRGREHRFLQSVDTRGLRHQLSQLPKVKQCPVATSRNLSTLLPNSPKGTYKMSQVQNLQRNQLLCRRAPGWQTLHLSLRETQSKAANRDNLSLSAGRGRLVTTNRTQRTCKILRRPHAATIGTALPRGQPALLLQLTLNH